MNAFKRFFKSFWLAVQFFTRWPTPQYASVSSEEMGRSLAWLPLVGLFIGLGLWALTSLQAWWSESVVALIILLAWVWSTGGLHIDGAADFADAWLGSCGDKTRALEIMKDSRIGTGGGVAIGLILLTKWVLLTQLLQTDWLVLLVLIPFWARIGSLMLMMTTPYASQNGMAETMFRHLNRKMVWLWLVIALGLMIVKAPGLVLIVLAWFWVRWLLIRYLGGMNGDGAGLMTEVLEIGALLILSASFIH
ncbi:adenosylcobinamide-GDP ribazoletransferase [Thiomicrospira sp.]|uniref:adenosylcobinamide-GDP ribazoletransferase n=1 Tax=Thiomicrospira sp. TaxID=935 RepID=UPI002F93CA1F